MQKASEGATPVTLQKVIDIPDIMSQSRSLVEILSDDAETESLRNRFSILTSRFRLDYPSPVPSPVDGADAGSLQIDTFETSEGTVARLLAKGVLDAPRFRVTRFTSTGDRIYDMTFNSRRSSATEDGDASSDEAMVRRFGFYIVGQIETTFNDHPRQPSLGGTATPPASAGTILPSRTFRRGPSVADLPT